jgi:hypothetical protein
MANYSDVNFIKHLLGISESFIADERLSPLHISLYYALFHSWNISKFQTPISISRHDIMRACKIGSANTYTKCLKELDLWNYIKYIPSHNPYKGSQIHMYNFNKTTNNASDISINKTTDKTSKKTIAKTNVKAAIPSINTLNNTNKVNKQNKNKEHEHTRKKSNSKSSLVVTKLFVNETNTRKRKKVAPKKEKNIPLIEGVVEDRGRATTQRPKRPLLKEVQHHFSIKQWSPIEAEKFFNYYQSNGWLVGGKTPMHSWKACASNWILNSEKFSKLPSLSEKGGGMRPVRPGKLSTNNDKNYGEPL